MKNITALIALICMIGVAGAQGNSLGEGYSSSQKAFFNEPVTSTFDPYVQSYWNNYIANKQSQSNLSMTTDMDLWIDSFPFRFSTPLNLGSTTFKANVSTQALSEKDKNSQALKTEVYRELGLNDLSSYGEDSGSLNISSGGTPTVDATGYLISQNIMSFFNI